MKVLVISAVLTLTASFHVGSTRAPTAPSHHYSTLSATSDANQDSANIYPATPGLSSSKKLSLPSRLLFTYVTPLIKKSVKSPSQPLSISSTWSLPPASRMTHRTQNLSEIYDSTRKNASNPKNSYYFAKALVLANLPNLKRTGLLRLTNTLIQAFPALFVAKILSCIESPAATSQQTLKWAAGLMVVLMCKMVCENQYFHEIVRMASSVRGSVQGCVYEKSLRVATVGGGESTNTAIDEKTDKKKKPVTDYTRTGTVLNLLTSDPFSLENTFLQIHTAWDGILQIAIYISLLFHFLGPAVLPGLAVLLSTIPLNYYTLRKLNNLRLSEMESKDDRTRRIAEVVKNVKSVKLNGLDVELQRGIRRVRKTELKRHRSAGILKAVNSAVLGGAPSLVLVVTLLSYVRSGRPIKVSERIE